MSKAKNKALKDMREYFSDGAKRGRLSLVDSRESYKLNEELFEEVETPQ